MEIVLTLLNIFIPNINKQRKKKKERKKFIIFDFFFFGIFYLM